MRFRWCFAADKIRCLTFRQAAARVLNGGAITVYAVAKNLAGEANNIILVKAFRRLFQPIIGQTIIIIEEYAEKPAGFWHEVSALFQNFHSEIPLRT